MTELIREDDTLNQGRKKLNNAIKAFNETVVEGDSSVEAAQARVDEKGQTHSTLKNRIDDGFTKVNTQLADIDQQKADKSYVNDLFENLGQLEVKGSYDSVGDLTDTYPNGTTGLFEIDGGLYAWNGNEWVKVFDLEVMPWADFLTEQDEEWVV